MQTPAQSRTKCSIKGRLIQTQRRGKWAEPHNDAVLLSGLHPDGSDVTHVYAAQRAKEAGLTVLVTRQQLPVCHHQATWDTRRGGHALGDDLREKSLQVMDCFYTAGVGVAMATDRPYSFRDGLTQQLHPLSHVLLVVGAEFQRRALRQDHLEGVGTLRAVWPPAAPTVLPPGKNGQKRVSSGSTTIIGDVFDQSQTMWRSPNVPQTDWQHRCHISSLSVQIQDPTATRTKEKQLWKNFHPPTLQRRLNKSTGCRLVVFGMIVCRPHHWLVWNHRSGFIWKWSCKKGHEHIMIKSSVYMDIWELWFV